MKNLTLETLEAHQKETLETLRKEYEVAWQEVVKASERVEVITGAIAKFQAQIFMAETKWKLEDKN